MNTLYNNPKYYMIFISLYGIFYHGNHHMVECLTSFWKDGMIHKERRLVFSLWVTAESGEQDEPQTGARTAKSLDR
jgi:hypothetical protein